MKVYKIRRRSDGLFSSGGGYPRFTKSGKVWRNLGGLKSHLTSVVGRVHGCGPTDLNRIAATYAGCDVVEYEVDPAERSRTPVEALLWLGRTDHTTPDGERSWGTPGPSGEIEENSR